MDLPPGGGGGALEYESDGICLPENENGAFGVGFCKKGEGGSLGVGFKKIGPFLV